jgi:hypothetical protein
LAEFNTPTADSFLGNNNSTLSQKILNIANTETEAMYSQTAWLMISGGKRYPW